MIVVMLVQTRFRGKDLNPGDLPDVDNQTAQRWFKNKIAVEAELVQREAEEVSGSVEVPEVDLEQEETDEVIETTEEETEVNLDEMDIPQLVAYGKEKGIEINRIPKADRKDVSKVRAFIKAALKETQEAE